VYNYINTSAKCTISGTDSISVGWPCVWMQPVARLLWLPVGRVDVSCTSPRHLSRQGDNYEASLSNCRRILQENWLSEVHRWSLTVNGKPVMLEPDRLGCHRLCQVEDIGHRMADKMEQHCPCVWKFGSVCVHLHACTSRQFI